MSCLKYYGFILMCDMVTPTVVIVLNITYFFLGVGEIKIK